MLDDRCQATRIDPVDEVIESECPDGPYRLCSAAAKRLREYSLRPSEWYNLAVIHNPGEFYLHDDFYDENGTACQPEKKLTRKEITDHPIPKLSDLTDSPAALVDFALTRFGWEESFVPAFNQLDPSELLTELQNRAASTCDPFKQCVFGEIAAYVLKERAGAFFRLLLAAASPETQRFLISLTPRIQPDDDHWQRMADALTGLPRNQRYQQCLQLADFRDPRSLDWIEANVCDPLMQGWGDLAAASGLDWPRVCSWLERGRPLSHVALDALEACNGPRLNQSQLMQRLAPTLKSPPPAAEFEAQLLAYAALDPVPRVKKTVAVCIEHRGRICRSV